MLTLRVGDVVTLVDHSPLLAVVGHIAAIRPHLDHANRWLYYVSCFRIDGGVEEVTSTNGTASAVPHLLSPDGYVYGFNGWYDECSLMPIDRGSLSSGAHVLPPLSDAEALRAATDRTPCELLYLQWSLRPWFDAPFASLGYLAAPSVEFAHSVHLCHRCLSPYFDLLSLIDHLDYCRLQRPPGQVIYRSRVAAPPQDQPAPCSRSPGADAALSPTVSAFLMDGSQYPMYCRNLALLTRCFVESKVLHNDVDMYDFVVVTVNRSLAALLLSSSVLAEEADQDAVKEFDVKRWDGEIVAGIFCRGKGQPNLALSCICTIPCFQRCGIGTLMLDLAYYLCHQRQTQCGCDVCGSVYEGCIVERPLSVWGEQLLLRLWEKRVLPALLNAVTSNTDVFGDTTDTGSGVAIPLDDVRRALVTRTHVVPTLEDFTYLMAKRHAFFYSTTDRDGGEPLGRLILDARVLSGRPFGEQGDQLTLPGLRFDQGNMIRTESKHRSQ